MALSWEDVFEMDSLMSPVGILSKLDTGLCFSADIAGQNDGMSFHVEQRGHCSTIYSHLYRLPFLGIPTVLVRDRGVAKRIPTCVTV